jgi:hypothetical protein
MENMGYVLIPEITEKSVTDVRHALKAAGFEIEVKDITGRSSFIRACRELQKKGVIAEGTNGMLRDKLEDDTDIIRFQFSRRYIESSGATYNSAAVVAYNKKSHDIHCDDPAVLALAVKLVNDVTGICQTSDIRSFLERVIREDTRRISIGLSSYFISAQHSKLVDKLEKFYAALNFNCVVLPVNHARAKGSILKHVVEDLKASVTQLDEEIKALKLEDKLTKKIAQHRIKDLRTQLSQYRELAVSLHTDLGAIVKGAGAQAAVLLQAAMPIDSLIASAQKGQPIDSLAADLFVAAEDMTAAFAVKHVAPVDIGAVSQDDFAPVELIGGKA